MNERNRPPLAVALHYSGSGAPRVVAKGGGLVAERIVETAREHNVPLQQDSNLAAALSRIDLGREIPRELYVAVAQVLAFAWSVAGKESTRLRFGDLRDDAQQRAALACRGRRRLFGSDGAHVP